MHISTKFSNNFTVIRIFLVFNQCRIRSDTRRADRRVSTVVFAVLCSAASIFRTGSHPQWPGLPPAAVKRFVNRSVVAFGLRCRLRPAAFEM